MGEIILPGMSCTIMVEKIVARGEVGEEGGGGGAGKNNVTLTLSVSGKDSCLPRQSKYDSAATITKNWWKLLAEIEASCICHWGVNEATTVTATSLNKGLDEENNDFIIFQQTPFSKCFPTTSQTH